MLSHHLRFCKEDKKKLGFALFMEKVLLMFWMHKCLNGIWQIGYLRTILIDYDIDGPDNKVQFVKLIASSR